MIDRLTKRGIAVLLAGMQAPPNMGKAYADEFNAIYPELAEKHGIGLYPFFLEGVAAVRDLNQADGIHPNEKGVEVIVNKMVPIISKALHEIVHAGKR